MFTTDDAGALLQTDLPLPARRGKVRDVYDLDGRLLIVSTDRISAFDHLLPVGIPDKGRLLTGMSQYWFETLEVDHHLISTDVPDDLPAEIDRAPLVGRVMVTAKADVVPYECVVRGFLEGSGLRDYRENGNICGIDLPEGLVQCERLPHPIFTPATKAETGHDDNVCFARMAQDLGAELAEELRRRSLAIYSRAAAIAAERGILIADTKFEFGHHRDRLLLIDEVLTPDSSRFWFTSNYRPGKPQPSLDKQFVREWLSNCGWDRNSPPPKLPPDVVARTREKYIEAYERLTHRIYRGSP